MCELLCVSICVFVYDIGQLQCVCVSECVLVCVCVT